MRNLPSLSGLKSFEAAARHASFTRAAAELNVTQGAVSHQVKALEDLLGLKLFHRGHQRLSLTRSGEFYLSVVRDALDRIAEGTERLLEQQRSGVLTVSTSPNFASKWLVHRLGRFVESHPEIDLRISAALHHVDFAREGIDLAVRHSVGEPAGFHVTRLCSDALIAVCSPRLVEAGLRAPSDLALHTLLHLDNRSDWLKWLQRAGVADADLSTGPVLNQASMAIDAAVEGQGVALARTTLAAADLISRRLVMPFGPVLPVEYAYWIVCPPDTAGVPKIAAFRDWLIAEAAADRATLRSVIGDLPE